MDQSFMKEKKILPLVLSMSLPMVISMAVNAMYNIVDSFFVAKLSENEMTSLALVYPVQNIITSIGVGIGIGINSTVAYYLGAEDKKMANKATTQGVVMNFIHGLLLTILCTAFMPAFLKMFINNQNIIDMSLEYANIVFMFSVASTVGITLEKIFQAVGQMKVSMFSMICGFATNIILDPLMIFGIGPFPKMGISGAAYATGIGQVISLLVYIIVYFARPIPVKVERKSLKPDFKLLKRLYGIGIPATLNMALPSFLISALNGILAEFSDKYVLVLGVYYKLQTFIYLSANGIIQGIRPLVGYNYGAGEHKRVEKIYHTTLKLTVLIMALGMALSWIIPSQLIGLFTANPETIKIGVTALHIISFGFIISAVSVTSSGALEGLGMGNPSLMISLLRYVIVIIPTAFVLSRFMGATGVWMAFAVAEFVTGIISYFIYQKYAKKTIE